MAKTARARGAQRCRCYGVQHPVRLRQTRRDALSRVHAGAKEVWLSAGTKEAFTAAVESGISKVLLPDSEAQAGQDWAALAKVEMMWFNDAEPASAVRDGDGTAVGQYHRVTSGSELNAVLNKTWRAGDLCVVDATDWSIIPAENLVATFQPSGARVFVFADTAASAKTLLGALERGVDGVVLRTDAPSEVRELARYIESLGSTEHLDLEEARVTAVDSLGMGERVCVDLCSRLVLGEGCLVGNFCRALFLVHSECAESSYINSRPFRVNAGPVHAYIAGPDDSTSYLAELQAGHEVAVVSAEGAVRTEIVGRCKVERRPLVKVSAATDDGRVHSIMLQNAETVKLVGPPLSQASGRRTPEHWNTIAVTDLDVDDVVYIKRSDAGRHLGGAVQEYLLEC